jgi:adenylate cyclase
MLGGSGAAAIRNRVGDALSLADVESDEDDLRLRKRMGVAAGYLTVGAPLLMPVLARGHPLAIIVGISLSAFSVANLVVLVRTRRFERYVGALIVAGSVFVPIATWLGGGITLASSGLVWGFLVPAYALLALGPKQAGRWYVAFLGIVVAALALEIVAFQPTGTDPYEIQLVGAIVNTVVPLTIVFAMMRYSDSRRRQAEARSEELLVNAIPVAIARRLKRGEHHIADLYPDTTVLFADLVRFTPWARDTEPARVAAVLDDLFRRFDRLAAAHGMEKIKTIGDAYMGVSGALIRRPDHAEVAMVVALGMLDETAAWRADQRLPLELRVGLASGPVVGGVIGDQRILFDLWGDTVNAAARMESSGQAGAVQLADSTRRLLGDGLTFVRRDIEVRGLGMMSAYLVRRPSDETA